jgi:hypothetical protein|tara:strand:+ start:299 stop:454 length:156 start_codon:yes stop_codon:yes gene_type:complete
MFLDISGHNGRDFCFDRSIVGEVCPDIHSRNIDGRNLDNPDPAPGFGKRIV